MTAQLQGSPVLPSHCFVNSIDDMCSHLITQLLLYAVACAGCGVKEGWLAHVSDQD